jgi:hypothetical protein
MPPQLSDYELETAARACRALAHREGEDAEKISDTALREPVNKRAQCAGATDRLVERDPRQDHPVLGGIRCRHLRPHRYKLVFGNRGRVPNGEG